MRIQPRRLGAVLLLGAMLAIPTGGVLATGTGREGCTPGYWKNHTASWEEFSPTAKAKSMFYASGVNYAGSQGTLLQGLQGGGGSGVSGAQAILLRAAIAAVLNAAHDSIGYPLTRPQFVGDVNAALASGNRQRMLDLATRLDRLNNLGCPLS